MKETIVGATLILGALLSGCGSGDTKGNSSNETALKIEKLENTGTTPQASTNKKGKFNLVGSTSARAKITAYIKDGSNKKALKLSKKSDGTFSKTIKMNRSTGQYLIIITAKSPNDDRNTKKFYLLNNSTAFQGLSEKEQAAQKRADKIAASKEKATKAANIAKKAKEEKQAAALASSEAATASKAQKASSKNSHTHGLSGLKYQADKYLKKDDSVAFYHPVKVLGYDDSKPYVANIEFKANDESKATMKDGALSILKGVKKADYKDFSNIKISFTQNVSDSYGKTSKNVPVLGYSFHRSTLESIDPNNMVSSDLDKVADSHFDKHVEGN